MTTKIKGGLNPAKKKGAAVNSTGNGAYQIENGYGTSIGQGALVKIGTGGFLELAASGDDVVGVFAGCKYIGTDGKPKEDVGFTAGTSNAGRVEGDITNVLAYVYDDPDMIFQVTADDVMAQTNIGEVFKVVNNGTTSVYKISGAQLDVGAAVSGDDDFRVVGKALLPGNELTNANPIVEVILTRHLYARTSA